MNIKTYFKTIYEEYLKDDLYEFKPWGKFIMYPFWLLKNLYYYAFFLPFYPIVYFIYSRVTIEQVNKYYAFIEKQRLLQEQAALQMAAFLGREIDEGARFLTGIEKEE